MEATRAGVEEATEATKVDDPSEIYYFAFVSNSVCYNFLNADKNVAWKLQLVERRCLLVSDFKPFLRFLHGAVCAFEVFKKERVS